MSRHSASLLERKQFIEKLKATPMYTEMDEKLNELQIEKQLDEFESNPMDVTDVNDADTEASIDSVTIKIGGNLIQSGYCSRDEEEEEKEVDILKQEHIKLQQQEFFQLINKMRSDPKFEERIMTFQISPRQMSKMSYDCSEDKNFFIFVEKQLPKGNCYHFLYKK